MAILLVAALSTAAPDGAAAPDSDIGISKEVTSGPTLQAGETTIFDLTYTIRVHNPLARPIDSVQVTDDIAAAFTAPASVLSASAASADFTVDYSGPADTTLLAGTDSIAAGATGTITLDVEVDTGSATGPFNNSASVSGIARCVPATATDQGLFTRIWYDGSGSAGSTQPLSVSFPDGTDADGFRVRSGAPSFTGHTTEDGGGTNSIGRRGTNEADAIRADGWISPPCVSPGQTWEVRAEWGPKVGTYLIALGEASSPTSADILTPGGIDGHGTSDVNRSSATTVSAANPVGVVKMIDDRGAGEVSLIQERIDGGAWVPVPANRVWEQEPTGGITAEAVSDDSDDGSNADPTSTNGSGTTDDPTPVVFPVPVSATKLWALQNDLNGDGRVGPGDTIRYTITVSNDGVSTANGMSVVDPTPANTTFGSTPVSTPAGSTDDSTAAGVDVNSFSVPGGESRSVVFDVVVDNPLPAGTTELSNTATVTGTGIGPITAGPTTTAITAAPVLTATKVDALTGDVDGDGNADPGDTITYTVEITNSGDIAASGITFTDSPDASTALTVGSVTTTQGAITTGNTAGDTSVAVSVGTIAGNGATATITFAVVIDDPVAAGTSSISNRGTVSSNELADLATDDPDVGGATDATETTVTASPSISATKVDALTGDVNSNGIAEPGDTITYTVVLTNSGDEGASGVSLADTPDINTTLVVGSVTTSQGGVIVGNGAGDSSVEVAVGMLAGDGGAATIGFDVVVNDPLPAGVIRVTNQATFSATGIPSGVSDDPAVAGAGDETATGVIGTPDLAVAKSDTLVGDDGDGIPEPGEQLTYTLTITNNGNQAASGLALNDTPDANTSLSVGSVSVDAGPGSVTEGNTAGDTSVGVAIATLNGDGASTTVSYTVTINSPIPAGVSTVSNQAVLASNELPVVISDDPDGAGSNEATVVGLDANPVLSASKRAILAVDANANSVPDPGDVLEYQIELSNTGNRDAAGVSFSDTPDANTTLQVGSVVVSQGSVSSGNSAGDAVVGVDFGTIGGLSGTASLSYRVVINDPLPAGVESIANRGTVSADNHPDVETDDPNTVAADETRTAVGGAPDLRISKTDVLFDDGDGDTRISPGDTLLYRVVIENTGNQNAVDLTFSDTPDANTTLEVGSVQTTHGVIDTGNTAGETTVAVSGIDVPAGTDAVITFRVTIADPVDLATSSVSNQGQVGSTSASNPDLPATMPTDDPETGADDDATVSSLNVFAELNLVKDAQDVNGGALEPGDRLRYTLVLANVGNQVTSDARISDTIDANTTLVDGSLTVPGDGVIESGSSSADTDIVVRFPLLGGSGDARSISFEVILDDPLAAGVTAITNHATAGSDTAATVESDDPATGDTGDATVRTTTAAPDISAVKSVNLTTDADRDGRASPGDTLTYSIHITNGGNIGQADVLVRDRLDANTTLVPGSLSTTQGTVTTSAGYPVSVNLGTLDGAGGSATVSFRVSVNRDIDPGVTRISNQGLITAPGIEPVTTIAPDGRETTDIEAGATADLEVSKTTTTPQGYRDERLVYRITVTNNGPADARNVRVQDLLPADLRLVRARSSHQGVCSNAVVCNIPGLANGQTATVEIIAIPQSGRAVTNSASATSDHGDANSSNSTATVRTPIATRGARLRTSVRLPKVARAGKVIRVKLCVRNMGPGTAYDATGTFRVPPGFTVVGKKFSARANAHRAKRLRAKRLRVGTVLRGGSVVFSVGDLPRGKRRCTVLRLRVAPSANGRVGTRVLGKASNARSARAGASLRVLGRLRTVLPPVAG